MVMSGWSVHLIILFSLLVNQYFVHILSLVTDNNPSCISRREMNDRKNDFMINLQESMVPGQDHTHDPWICSQTRIPDVTVYILILRKC